MRCGGAVAPRTAQSAARGSLTRGARALLILSITPALLTACGSAPAGSLPAWRAEHPEPSGLAFDDNAPGVCQLTPQYPDEAPAAIEYLGNTYVQTGKSAQPPAPPGTMVATSGSWTIRAGDDAMYVLTGSAMYAYSLNNTC